MSSSSQSSIVEQLQSLTRNLWWCWHPDVWQIFNELDPELWRTSDHNPTAFLAHADAAQVELRARDNALATRIRQALRRQQDYLNHRGPLANMEAGPLHTAPVAYFCAEFGIHESLRIYSGGLGILAGDHMKAASDLAVPIVGVGLFYALGYFRQTIDEQGWQQEHYDEANTDHMPITKLTDTSGAPIEISVESGESTIFAHVWELMVGRNRLLLLDANVEKNSEEDRALTSLLYGGDRRTRIRQELLLGVGGVRLLAALDIHPGVFHLNEGHSAFAPLELCYRHMQDEGLSFEEARARVSKKTVFTTHTPVPAGHDRFTMALFEQTMSPLRERLGMDHQTFHDLGRVNPGDVNETFCMTVLAVKMSDYRNGVSHLHGRVSRHMWRGLFPQLETSRVSIGHITNGVHVSTFLAPQMRALYDKHLPAGWEQHQEDKESWRGMAEVDPGELWEVHQVLKAKMINFVQDRVERQTAPSGKQQGQVVPGSGFDPDVLTIGFARRFATYKRANLLFDDMDRIKRLLTSVDRPIQLVFAGKSHPADDGGKALIQRIIDVSLDPAFKGRVVFLADYDMDIARHMVQGVDVWLNNPRRPEEACGTSGQKVVLNGVLNCSILDGWWAEGYDGLNGFAIGHGAEFNDPARQDEHDSEQLYKVLEEQVIPLYYSTDETGLHAQWLERMTWGIISLGWRFNANRMVLDYMRNAYLPAVGATHVGVK